MAGQPRKHGRNFGLLTFLFLFIPFARQLFFKRMYQLPTGLIDYIIGQTFEQWARRLFLF
jgi:hypothetical protein